MMNSKKILFICGSLNQTTMMHQISRYLKEYDLFFTPFYGDGLIKKLADAGHLDFSILGGQFRQNTINYLLENNLKIDYEGQANDYDMVFICTDLIVQRNIKNKKIILVQEGMTDSENVFYNFIKWLKLPRYISGTAATGQSHIYDYFCVASEGYKDFFVNKGLSPDKLVVTGIPNFDNCSQYLINNFPYKNYVLAATSDTRETFKFENRKKFIENCLRIADGRKLIFKLHPNENPERSTHEINKYAPDALVFPTGNTNHMIANCDVLITRYSSVVYVGLALNKEVYSEFDINILKKLIPLQNGGTSAKNVADKAIELLNNNRRKIFDISKEPFVKIIKTRIMKVA